MTEELTEAFSDAGVAATALLLEREGVLAELGAALSRARSGHGRVVLVQGPAGIGKTRLLNETRARAQALGLRVLTASGGQLEGGYGFGVARQLLEAAVASASGEAREELLTGAAALAEPVFRAAAAPPSEVTDATQSVLHGLYWLVANLSERSPLLLAIDDVHWADGPSLRFLVYLARRLEGLPVALVLALRTGEVSAEPELLRALRVQAHPPVLQPRALSARATQMLTTARLARAVPDALARACHAATRGNPFLLTELLHQLADASDDIDPAAVERMASGRVAAAILLRVARVGTPAVALVQAMAVLGEASDLELVASLAELDGSVAAALADALVAAEIAEPADTAGRLRFVHPLVRSAVYDDMLRGARARLHARAAQLLVRDWGDSDAAAAHVLFSDPAGDPRTVALLRDAARRSLARGAPESAVEFLRRAARERGASGADRAELLLELGAAAARAGDPDGVGLLREAFRLAGGQPARARAGLELAFALGVSSSNSLPALDVLESAREDLEDERLRTLLDARIVMFSILVPSVRTRLSAHLRAARTALQRPVSDDGLVLLGPLATDLIFVGAPASEIADLAERVLGSGDLMRRDVTLEADFALGALAALIHAGRLREAKHHVDRGVDHARARGSPFALARLCAYRALLCWRVGELAGAESDAHFALSVDAAWGIPHAVSTAVLAQVQIERGDLGAAQRLVDGLDSDPALLEVTPNQIVRETRAALLIALARPRDALTQLHAYARWEQQSELGDHLGLVAWRPMAARAHLQLGETAQARQLAQSGVLHARAFGAGPQLGAALGALANVEGGTAGVALLEEAVSVLEKSAARLDHARAVVELGAMLRRCGPRAAATDRLRAGMELAHGCAATALVERAATELRLAGARPRRIALRGHAALTPAEHRVSELASDGMTNKQIAQALFVTLRTVEMHLSNAYRKLGISSREQLAGALEEK